MKRFSTTLNEYLYKTFSCKEKLWLNIFYKMIPFVLLLVLYTILGKQHAFKIENGYGFLDDFTNMYTLFYVFIFIYFVSGKYYPAAKKVVQKYIGMIEPEVVRAQYCNDMEKCDKYAAILHIISITLSLCGFWFIYIANLNGDKNWYSLLSNSELLYYSFLITFSWYMSANVLFRTLIISATFDKVLRSKVLVDIKNIDGTGGFQEFFKTVFHNFGLAIYFVIGITIIVISDFRAIQFGIENAFYKYKLLLCPIALLLVFYAAFIITPAIRGKKLINTAVDNELKKYSYPDEHIKNIQKIKTSMFTQLNIFKFISLNIIPIVGLVVQIIQLIYQ